MSDIKSLAHTKVELQISYSICPQVPEAGFLW